MILAGTTYQTVLLVLKIAFLVLLYLFNGVWVSDVGSTNGTFVNGVRIDAPRKLETGDVVRIGETELRFDA